LGGTIHSQRFR
jgi:ABC-type uncharacterized transport system substrate-binding protein